MGTSLLLGALACLTERREDLRRGPHCVVSQTGKWIGLCVYAHVCYKGVSVCVCSGISIAVCEKKRERSTDSRIFVYVRVLYGRFCVCM
jgi:hypothetical protein